MSVIFGFVILLMIFFLVYMGYRLILRKEIIVLISFAFELAAFTFAIFSFLGNVLTTGYMEFAFIFFGILIPGAFFVYDYTRMMRKIREHGIYEGFVEPVRRVSEIEKAGDLNKRHINSIIKERQVHELINDLSINGDDIIKNIKKSLVQAQTHINGQDYENAYEIYNTLVKLVKNCPGLYFNHGNTCYSLERYTDAVHSYKKVLELNDKLIKEISSPKEVFPVKKSRKDKLKKSGDKLETEVNIRHEEFMVYYNIGNCYFKLNKYDQAIEHYKKALEINPTLEEAAENTARALIALDRVNEALDSYKKIIEGDSNNFRAHYTAGLLYTEVERYGEAIEPLKQCIKLNSSFLEAYEAIGKVYSKTGKHTEAIESYKKLVKLVPTDHRGYYNLGTSYYQSGSREKAVEAFKKAIELKPDSFKGYYNMAVALDELSKQEEAIEAFKKVIELKTDFIDAYNNLGIILSTQGRYLEALDIYTKGLKKNPEEYSLYFNMGITLYDMGKYQEAVDAYKNALELKPDEHEIFYHLGAALMELKRYNEAVSAYKNALKVKPSDSEILYNLAVVYSLIQKTDIALDTLKKAIESDKALKEEAKSERAFDNIRNRKEFKELVLV